MTESGISKFYEGRRILITGASGFIGKVLVWKLLQSTDVEKIYVLVRTKRGRSAQARVRDEILQTPIFDNFRSKNPEALDKVIGISGDIGVDNLDLSDEDKCILRDEVSVIFHIAAILNMDASLKDAINMNTKGTLRVLTLALEIKNLICFVHTSTAYCCCDKEYTEEKVYPAMEDPYDVIHTTDWLYNDITNRITPLLISPHPNTYTYTKRLAENIVYDFKSKLPVVIARPSIVVASFKEPLPGWVDNLNGPTGILVAGGKGVVRSMFGNGDTKADVIAVDVVANSLIAITWKHSLTPKSDDLPVYHVTYTEEEPITWNEISELGLVSIQKYPFETTLWYPGGGMYNNKFVHIVLSILFHWIPAYLIDFLMMIIGKPCFMVRVQKKIKQGQEVLHHFTIRNWNFSTKNILALKHSMSETDLENFPVTMRAFSDREKFFDTAVYGARLYLMKDDPQTIPKAKQRMKILYYVDRITRMVFVLLFVWIFINIFATAIKKSLDR